MAQVPLDLRLSLREGSIYYFTERRLTSATPHFHVVVNDPLRQKVVLCGIVTSKVEKVKYRRRACAETLVQLGPSDIPDVLTRGSIIDCNRLLAIPLDEFCERWARKEIAAFDKDVPVRLRNALRRAIHSSEALAPEVRALVAEP